MDSLLELNSDVDIVNHFGVRLFLDRNILSARILASIYEGRYEADEANALEKIIDQNERVIELGAGLGFISTLLARNPKVEALRVFEANPALIPYILKVHEENSVRNTEVINAVLTHDSTIKPIRDFYVRHDFWASSLSAEPFTYEKTVPVTARSFNGEIKNFRPTMIVCDIEGGELELFKNSELTGVRKIFLEVHQQMIGGDGIKHLFDTLSGLGFHYNQYHSKGASILFSLVSS